MILLEFFDFYDSLGDKWGRGKQKKINIKTIDWVHNPIYNVLPVLSVWMEFKWRISLKQFYELCAFDVVRWTSSNGVFEIQNSVFCFKILKKKDSFFSCYIYSIQKKVLYIATSKLLDHLLVGFEKKTL